MLNMSKSVSVFDCIFSQNPVCTVTSADCSVLVRRGNGRARRSVQAPCTSVTSQTLPKTAVKPAHACDELISQVINHLSIGSACVAVSAAVVIGRNRRSKVFLIVFFYLRRFNICLFFQS